MANCRQTRSNRGNCRLKILEVLLAIFVPLGLAALLFWPVFASIRDTRKFIEEMHKRQT